MVSCSNNAPTAPTVQLPPRWNIYDLPSVSEFDRKKTARPTTEQVKKSLQLLADETAKDPESLKIRRVKVVEFKFFKGAPSSEVDGVDVDLPQLSRASGIQYFGHPVRADIDSKNSYGGYEGYKTKLFSIAKPGATAKPLGSVYPLSRWELKFADESKKKRNELSEDEFVNWLAEHGVVPEEGGRQDTYTFTKSRYKEVVWWIPKRP
jgi:hypothetical protein